MHEVHKGPLLQLEHQLAGLVKKIKESSRRRNFYLAFSQSPVDFINSLIASQARFSLSADMMSLQRLQVTLNLTKTCSLAWLGRSATVIHSRDVKRHHEAEQVHVREECLKSAGHCAGKGFACGSFGGGGRARLGRGATGNAPLRAVPWPLGGGCCAALSEQAHSSRQLTLNSSNRCS